MRILFDQGVPKKMRQHLPGHEAQTAYEAGLNELENGDLLREAEKEFDVLLTTDSNIKYQQRLSEFDIALVVLRAFTNSLDDYLPLVPQLMATLEKIAPGEVEYLYADEKLRRRDELKGQRKQP
jgi:predicted nuclease of predicted toxin-antitoxin system